MAKQYATSNVFYSQPVHTVSTLNAYTWSCKHKSMAAASEQCTVYGRVIVQVRDKYRLIKAPRKPADAIELTKVGEALLNVTKSPDVLQLIKEDKLISSCCYTNCYKFIFKVKKAEQQLYLLRSELESKIKNTYI